ncbi:ABATE domain-containing protein [Streptomyces sp. APSN-46.1]|uniref:ABATE domain-containing protein n=1 Tax=Streptomyces sp. APSN-46.1 TaxID=2929049 RepID=UPI001FB29FAF|nr:ABATE domain-containing protein [Streptomyces sp. APSN-46.1]MCJ1676199.1 ABATE domain-containing protein [Streptomyces sp. APSN-46.1]
MTIRDLQEMPWIGEDPVLDLANTVVVGAGPGRGDIDFFTDRELTRRWRARAADRRLAALPLEELERLRGLVRDALDSTAGRNPLTDRQRTRLNELASSAPIVLQMTAEGLLGQQEQGGDAAAVVARETLVLAAGPNRQRVRRCHAPSCGMFFLARRRDQAWCSLGCGNRARSTRRQPQETRP